MNYDLSRQTIYKSRTIIFIARSLSWKIQDESNPSPKWFHILHQIRKYFHRRIHSYFAVFRQVTTDQTPGRSWLWSVFFDGPDRDPFSCPWSIFSKFRTGTDIWSGQGYHGSKSRQKLCTIRTIFTTKFVSCTIFQLSQQFLVPCKIFVVISNPGCDYLPSWTSQFWCFRNVLDFKVKN